MTKGYRTPPLENSVLLLLLPLATLLQPRLKVLRRHNLFLGRDIHPIALVLKEGKHGAHVLDHPEHQATQEGVRLGHLLANNLLKLLAGLLQGQLIPGNAHGLAGVLVRVVKGLGSKQADVADARELQLGGGLEGGAPHGRHELAKDARVEVVHEGDGAQDGPGKSGRVLLRLVADVQLDVMLGHEMRDLGARVVPALLVATTVNR